MPETVAIDVAVGVMRRLDGSLLFARRPAGKPYAGYWEFPGGKVEPGETVEAALVREFEEELGVQVLGCEPWCCVEHVYPHAHVHLHFFVIHQWHGEPQSLEGQDFAWEGPNHALEPILPATIPLLEWLHRLDEHRAQAVRERY